MTTDHAATVGRRRLVTGERARAYLAVWTPIIVLGVIVTIAWLLS
jgi:hypothetical protein